MQPHGSRTRYTLNGCRCPDCTRAQRDYQRERIYKVYGNGGVFEQLKEIFELLGNPALTTAEERERYG